MEISSVSKSKRPSIAIAVMRELGLPEDIVTSKAARIAHGDPIGATGAVLTTRLLHSMKRDGIESVLSHCVSAEARASRCLEATH
jgi:acetyl-CoA C-acetyltransferase